MKRPALVSALAVVLAVLSAFFLPRLAVCTIIIGLVFTLILSIIIKNKGLFLIALSMVLALTSYTLYDSLIYSKDNSFEGYEAVVCGRVEKQYSEKVYKIKPYSVICNNEEISLVGDIVITLSDDAPPLEMYSAVEASGKLYSVKNRLNIGDGAYLQMYPEAVSEGDIASPLGLDLSYRVRLYIKSACERLGASQGGFAESLLTGNNRLMLYGDVEDFKALGLAHVLAVSGLHLSVCLGFLDVILKKIGIYRPLRIALNVIFISLMLIVANFSPSICRAAVMNFIFLFGDIVSRPTDPLNSLGGSVAIIGILNPMMLINAGFIMSVTAVWGIITLYPLFEFYIRNKPLRKLYKTVIISFCATLATLPVAALYFNEFSYAGIPANIFANIFIPVILLGSVILCMISWVPNVSSLIVIALRFIINIFLSVIRFFGERISVADIASAPMILLLVFLIALGIILYFAKKKIRKIIPILCLCTLFALSLFAGTVHNNTVFSYHIDKTQDLSLQYAYNDNAFAVTYCGDKASAFSLYELLQDKGFSTADIYVLPSYQKSAVEACEYVLENKLTKCIVLPDIDTDKKYDIIKRADKNNAEVCLISGNKTLEYVNLSVSFGLISDSDSLYENQMYSYVSSHGFTVLNTYSCDNLLHTPKADAVIASDEAIANTSYSESKLMLVQGSSMPEKSPAKTYILGGYQTDITLNEYGKFTLSRERK